MKVIIDVCAGRYHREDVKQEDIQKNIDAIDRYINGVQTCSDDVLLMDTKSILNAIKRQLPY